MLYFIQSLRCSCTLVHSASRSFWSSPMLRNPAWIAEYWQDKIKFEFYSVWTSCVQNYCCFSKNCTFVYQATSFRMFTWYFVVLVFWSSSPTTFWLLSFTMKFSRFLRASIALSLLVFFRRRTFYILSLCLVLVNGFLKIFSKFSFNLLSLPFKWQLLYITTW